MTFFSVTLLWFLVALLVWLAKALEVVMVRIMEAGDDKLRDEVKKQVAIEKSAREAGDAGLK